MTDKKIPCEVIRDLLPLYVEGLTSDTTRKEIEEHVKGCGACMQAFERIQRKLKEGEEEEKQGRDREIDYLKRIRKSGAKKIAISVLSVFFLFLSVIALKFFVIGSVNEQYGVLYANVYEDYFTVSGMCYDSASAVSDYRIEKKADGSTELLLYTCLPSFLHKDGSFTFNIYFDEIGTGLSVGGVTVKPDGSIISKLANDVYSARNPYVGDVLADGKLVESLGMMTVLGTYATTQLQTSEEPYGWTFHFKESVKDSAFFEEWIQKYACVLIAMTDNLSEVHWTYTVELEDRTVERAGSITEEECSTLVGAPVKKFAESPEKVQELLAILEIPS